MELNFGSQVRDFHTNHNCSRVAGEDFRRRFSPKIINIMGSTGINLFLSITTNKSSWADRKLTLIRKTLCQNLYHKFYEIRPSLSTKIRPQTKSGRKGRRARRRKDRRTNRRSGLHTARPFLLRQERGTKGWMGTSHIWCRKEVHAGCSKENLKKPLGRTQRKAKGLPQQAEMAQGVPGKLRPRIFLTFGTTRVVGRQPYAPPAFIPE